MGKGNNARKKETKKAEERDAKKTGGGRSERKEVNWIVSVNAGTNPAARSAKVWTPVGLRVKWRIFKYLVWDFSR